MTDQQTRQLQPIVLEHVRSFMEVFETIKPVLRENLDTLDREVRPLLREDQFPAWEAYYIRRAARFAPEGVRAGRPPQ